MEIKQLDKSVWTFGECDKFYSPEVDTLFVKSDYVPAEYEVAKPTMSVAEIVIPQKIDVEEYSHQILNRDLNKKIEINSAVDFMSLVRKYKS